MDEHEARAILSRRIDELRTLSYEQLIDHFLLEDTARREPTWEEAHGQSGATYRLKIYAYRDSAARDDIRVVVDLHGRRSCPGDRRAMTSSSLRMDRSSASS